MELTSLELNNNIVRFRKVVGQARFRVAARLIRRMKQFNKKMAKEQTDDRRKKCEKKLERYGEDLQAIKKIRRDDVSKFALLNTKTLQELKITGKTPPADRAMYKMATSEVLVSAVEEFREKYPNWHREVPFILQRLGLQYKVRKGEREASEIKNLLKKMALDKDDGEEEQLEPKDSLLAKVKLRRKEEKSARKNKLGKTNAKSMGRSKLERSKRKKLTNESSSHEDTSATSVSKEFRRLVPKRQAGPKKIRARRAVKSENAEQIDGISDIGQSSAYPETDESTSVSTKDPFFVTDSTSGPEPELEDKQKTVARKLRRQSDLGKKLTHVGQISRRSDVNFTRGSGSHAKPTVRNEGKPQLPDKRNSSIDDGSSLHPSWEAKKKQRLLQQSVSSAPAGKKIKFDSND